jgi:CheY-like chemotaxis protein
VLFVDDNEDARDIAKMGLEYEGAMVDVAASAAEAMVRLSTVQPDVIITDMSMPGISGDEFLAQLKASPASRGIPVIGLSGALGDVRTVGFADYLLKPVDPTALAAVILRVLAGPKRE